MRVHTDLETQHPIISYIYDPMYMQYVSSAALYSDLKITYDRVDAVVFDSAVQQKRPCCCNTILGIRRLHDKVYIIYVTFSYCTVNLGGHRLMGAGSFGIVRNCVPGYSCNGWG